MHILISSWYDSEYTGDLQCLSHKIER